MPYLKTEQLPDEPIFIVSFEGTITPDDVKAAYMDSNNRWYDDLQRTGWHIIIDLQNAERNFLGTLNALRASTDMDQFLGERLFSMTQYVVGSDSLTKLYSDSRKLPQFGGQPVPLFRSIEFAIEAARQNVQNRIAGIESVSTSEPNTTP